jgi:hypothetical protein
MRFLWLVAALALCLPTPSEAGLSSHHSTCCGSHKGWKRSRTPSNDTPPSPRCTNCLREKRIKRSPGARHEPTRQTVDPHGRKDYRLEHDVPLACGGADAPPNVQGQTRSDAKAKGKIDRTKCGR